MFKKKLISKDNVPYIFLGVLLLAIVIRGNACILKNITGLPCPSCGLTRAYYAVLGGDIKTAFFCHPLFWAVPFIFIFAANYKKVKYNKLILLFILAVFLAVYIVRMILYFPDTPPMDYNSRSILARAFHILINLKGN